MFAATANGPMHAVAVLNALVVGLHVPAHGSTTPGSTLDAAFALQLKMQREINRLACPDLPLWLTFEGITQHTVVSGSASTAALHNEVARLHNLDPDQPFRFIVSAPEGQITLPPGMALSETPLANSENLEVQVHPIEWPVKRGRRSCRSRPRRRM